MHVMDAGSTPEHEVAELHATDASRGARTTQHAKNAWESRAPTVAARRAMENGRGASEDFGASHERPC